MGGGCAGAGGRAGAGQVKRESSSRKTRVQH